MNKVGTLSTAGIVIALVGGTVLLLEPGKTQPQAKGVVVLQPTAPGSAQTGHTNITGSAYAGQFVGGGAGLTGVNSNLLDGLDSTAFLRPNFPIITTTTDPAATIQAENTANAGIAIKGVVTTSVGGSSPSGVYGLNTSVRGEGVLGISNNPSGIVYGGRFQTNSPDAIGVYARADAGSGSPIAGYFVSNAPEGIPLYCLAQGSNGTPSGWFHSYQGTGIYGDGSPGVHGQGGYVGVRGTVSGSSGSHSSGVEGIVTGFSGTNHGVFGSTSNPTGDGVFGWNTGSTGNAVGVTGESWSTTGRGVYGVASASSGGNYGVYGKTQSTSGTGVFGEATDATGSNAGGYFKSISSSGVGVYGVATANGTNIGVWGITNAASGWGVYSDGRLGATVKLFCIDDPRDPLNKYLQHYCSEGPEPLNVYTGNVKTDSNGEAWVDLPDYFESINKDFRYTLTVIDDTDSATFALAKVARKIRDGRFKIRTSEPRIEVTWRVEGVRNDPWMQKYGAPVSVEKLGSARGKYQRPELYDAPPEMGMHWSPDDQVAPKRQ
ncbi:MAG: hypothetical protein K1X67_11155 [Fimbriimonadaceae bacterium]|nr:hypothetical protein [Fimbriimonadaceae bacterium]